MRTGKFPDVVANSIENIMLTYFDLWQLSISVVVMKHWSDEDLYNLFVYVVNLPPVKFNLLFVYFFSFVEIDEVGRMLCWKCNGKVFPRCSSTVVSFMINYHRHFVLN